MILDIAVVMFALYSKAFCNAMCFGKGGEKVYEIWHIAEWIRFWLPALYFLVRLRTPWQGIVVVAALSFVYNFFYVIFRTLNVYKFDNKYRIMWLSKILDRGGVI